MNHKDYDNWKLDNNEQDCGECWKCENSYNVDDLHEYKWRDADFDLRQEFVCENCIEDIQNGDI